MMENMVERWVEVKNHPEYEVSSNGRVRRIKDGMILRQSSNVKNGAMRVCLNRKRYYVHRLVAEAFFGDDSDRVVRHRDGNKRNNSVLNLVKEVPDYSQQMNEDEDDLWP